MYFEVNHDLAAQNPSYVRVLYKRPQDSPIMIVYFWVHSLRFSYTQNVVRCSKPHWHHAQFSVRYGEIWYGRSLDCPSASQIASVPILSGYSVFNFRFGADKIENYEIWTTRG